MVNIIIIAPVIFGSKLSLLDLVNKVHVEYAKRMEWKNCKPLIPGSYGFDNIAVCIGDLNKPYTDNKEAYNRIHESWIKNYIFWRDNKPWNWPLSKYRKPYAELSDERRELCAKLKFSELSEEEQNKDILLFESIKTVIN